MHKQAKHETSKNQLASRTWQNTACHLLLAGFLLGLLFNPEDGVNMFLLNDGGHLPNYMGLQTQETVLFTVTAVRTSNTTIYKSTNCNFSISLAKC
jgi:hypothetical protein